VTLVEISTAPNGVATLTFNDEKNLNAMSEQMATEFLAAVHTLRTTENLRAVILTGKGKAFSAGGHLEMLDKKRTLPGETNRVLMHSFYNSFLSLLELKVPLIAAINGAAIGAGLCVACACDIRIATTNAKLGFTFLKLGLHPGMGATYLVPRIIGRSAATELLLTARVVDAQEAFRLGLVSNVVEPSQLSLTVDGVVQELLSCGRESSAQLLETMRADLTGLRSALEREALCQSINYASAEFAEGVSALREKRTPTFGSK
jgi:enoyl-CoA hydratase/carnithine racemase